VTVALQIQPYLNFDGSCAAAFRFYEKALGGNIVMLQAIGESPMKDQLPPETHGRVMHVHLEVGGGAILGADAQPGQYKAPASFSVSVQLADLDHARRVFTTLGEGGRETMAFQKTFWSPGFGMLVDRFGIPWMVNCTQNQG
jgi:PhnB protein